MIATADLSTATPVEIDTELARIWAEIEKVRRWLNSDLAHMASRWLYEGDRPAIEARIAEREAAIEALRAEARPFEIEYLRRPWKRYFLVTNGNGHVHRGMGCSTCYSTTLYAWLIDLADCDEAAMVAEYGEMACTVCFPAAPTMKGFGDGTSARARRTAAELAEREAEKARKAAEKAAKAITDVDGSPLADNYGGVLRTKVAARNALADAVVGYGWYGPTHPSDFLGFAKRMVEALEAAGVETAPVIERAKKRVKKEGGEHVFPVLGEGVS